MSDLESRMERFTVAADTLVEAYGDLSVRGRFSDPPLAAAALANIKNLMGHLANAGLDKVAFTGADINRLTQQENEFREHACDCPFCIGCGPND